MLKPVWLLALLLLSFFYTVKAQQAPEVIKTALKDDKKKWYENFSIRGYMQIRYNRLFETNENLVCEQCDRSWGKNGGIFIRRGRIILSGFVTDRIFFYIQPDFASSTGSTLNILQLRDAYVDFGFDKKNEFRLRIGQSKIPFGFENLQSSQNRLPLDRNDGLNSAVANERDFGAFFYWAPESKRKLFSDLVKNNLKGSGDYGVFALGVYNGQTANRPEQNNTLHVVSRFSYPFTIGKQIVEPGVQAYTGKFVVPADSRSTGVKGEKNFEYMDKRIATSVVIFPQPFGIQAEYNWGKGPEYNTVTDSIETKNLNGGYITASYQIINKHSMAFFPFARATRYDGGKKHELDARSYSVRELEAGLEWQLNKNFEFTVSYVISKRKFEDDKNRDNTQKGRLLRLQAQLNF